MNRPRNLATALIAATSLTLAGGLVAHNDDAAEAADPFTVWAVGDMCDDDNTPQPDCSEVADLIDTGLPDYFIGLGDLQYENGALAKFQTYYHPKVGTKVNDVTKPVPGNHEYQGVNSVASGYYTYFGASAGDPSKGYYSFTQGNWKIIGLNSVCGKIADGCGYALPQAVWLRDQLAGPETCEILFNHHPPLSDGSHGDTANMKAGFWRRAVEGKAELFLSGHEHNYQRFAPRNAAYTPVAGGVRAVVVGTGGKDLTAFGATNRSEFRQNTKFGALRLTLTDTGYSGAFVNVDGVTMDTFSGSCLQ